MLQQYQLKDISVVIPTYRRASEISITLKALQPFLNEINEVIVVDQSEGTETKEVVKKFGKRVHYVFSKIPSITIARNKGVQASSKKTKIICFIDDDVSIKKDYFKGILEVFNTYSSAKGAAAFVPLEAGVKKEGPFIRTIKRFFFLGGRFKVNHSRIASAYGNQYPLGVTKIIGAEWLTGDNMVYLKEIFTVLTFDENLKGYTVAEDIDFSYRVAKKYPNSVYITPHAHIWHRFSIKARYPTARLSFLNQVDHFYFNSKNLNKTILDKGKFIWCLGGITLLRILQTLFSCKKEDFLKTWFYFRSLLYCVTHLTLIKRGKVREFENILKEKTYK